MALAAARCGRGALTPLLAAVSFFAFAATTLTAAPLQRDLGAGLVYFRISAAPADLPSKDAVGDHSCVLDLRYARADTSAAQQLASWVAALARPQRPVFVLANNATAPVLLRALADAPKVPGLFTVGIASPHFGPEFPVSQTPADELAAFEALANGATVGSVTTDNPNKQRNDEASLSREARPDDTAVETDKARQDAATAQPRIDAALQRAVHLHRGLKALKQIE